jgi:uncharacterized protein YciI
MPETIVYAVVLHRPGRAWRPGVDFREQPGVDEHVAHYAAYLEAGNLEFGGPFLGNDEGGLMVAAADVPVEELEAFAAADPAVASGLLTYEVRSWYVPMRRH